MTAFPAAALAFLRCPVCRGDFTLADRSLRCANGHSYDLARHGYVNLLPGDARPGTADTAEMVAAREEFLAAGHFAGLREFVGDAAQRACGEAAEERSGARSANVAPGGRVAGRCLVEIGAGTGYYLAGLLDRFPGTLGLALDISKFAARRAARAHERVAAVVCDAWKELPVRDGTAALVLDVFAPRNPAEFRRILAPEGRLLVVTPTGRHLRELVGGLGLLSVDERKPQRLERALGEHFRLVEETSYERLLVLKTAEAAALAAMGPSAHHLEGEERARRLAALTEPVDVTLSVAVATYAPR